MKVFQRDVGAKFVVLGREIADALVVFINNTQIARVDDHVFELNFGIRLGCFDRGKRMNATHHGSVFSKIIHKEQFENTRHDCSTDLTTFDKDKGEGGGRKRRDSDVSIDVGKRFPCPTQIEFVFFNREVFLCPIDGIEVENPVFYLVK